MKTPFRHGLVRYQTDNAPVPNPTFLQASNGGTTIDLIVAPDPTIITFANGVDNDYLFEERVTVTEAWAGPFVSGTDYWIYWDIDTFTAERTFGHTLYAPIVSAFPPVTPPEDQHWFDTTNEKMKVFTGGLFIEKIRVFAAKYANGGVIQALQLGTQIGDPSTTTSGFILFDDKGVAIRKVQDRRIGHFVTSESDFKTHASNAHSVRFETIIRAATAIENIAGFQLVSYKDVDRIGFASNLDTSREIVGIIREDLFTGEVGHFITQGYVTNPVWDWSAYDAGTRLFCDETGQITVDVPQINALQEVAIVVSPITILLGIRHMIIVE